MAASKEDYEDKPCIGMYPKRWMSPNIATQRDVRLIRQQRDYWREFGDRILQRLSTPLVLSIVVS